MDSKKIVSLQKLFESRGLTLALAESCTGGLLSSWIAAEPGVSKFFLGSVVSYHGSVKNKILQVPMSLLQVTGEVSTPVALAMARGVRKQLGSDWSVAITGVAGPTGGSVDKPVGLVCFGVVGPGGREYSLSKNFCAEQKSAGGDLARHEIQERSAEFALEFLVSSI